MSTLDESIKRITEFEKFEREMIEKNIITYRNAIIYRNYRIYNNDTVYPNGEAFRFSHIEYDGAGDKRLGYGHTIEECVKLINEQIAEYEVHS